MRPDKIYAPDSPNPKQTVLYKMVNIDGTREQKNACMLK